jgi:hypothetical protein
LAQVKQKLVDSGMKIAAAIPAINPTFAVLVALAVVELLGRTT